MHLALTGGLATVCLVAGARWALQPLTDYAAIEGVPEGCEPSSGPRGVGRRRLLQWEAFGLYYGFPACCTREFMANSCADTKRAYPDGPWSGSGFIPCAACAQAAHDWPRFIAEVIQPQRLCVTPFPQEGPNEVADAILAMVHAPEPHRLTQSLLRWRGRLRAFLGAC